MLCGAPKIIAIEFVSAGFGNNAAISADVDFLLAAFFDGDIPCGNRRNMVNFDGNASS